MKHDLCVMVISGKERWAVMHVIKSLMRTAIVEGVNLFPKSCPDLFWLSFSTVGLQ